MRKGLCRRGTFAEGSGLPVGVRRVGATTRDLSAQSSSASLGGLEGFFLWILQNRVSVKKFEEIADLRG